MILQLACLSDRLSRDWIAEIVDQSADSGCIAIGERPVHRDEEGTWRYIDRDAYSKHACVFGTLHAGDAAWNEPRRVCVRGMHFHIRLWQMSRESRHQTRAGHGVPLVANSACIENKRPLVGRYFAVGGLTNWNEARRTGWSRKNGHPERPATSRLRS